MFYHNNMSEEPPRKSHKLAWILSIVAVLVLYVLSVGPVCYFEIRGRLPHPRPHWLNVVYEPLYWLFKTPLGKPFDAYLNWWASIASARNPDPFTSAPSKAGTSN